MRRTVSLTALWLLMLPAAAATQAGSPEPPPLPETPNPALPFARRDAERLTAQRQLLRDRLAAAEAALAAGQQRLNTAKSQQATAAQSAAAAVKAVAEVTQRETAAAAALKAAQQELARLQTELTAAAAAQTAAEQKLVAATQAVTAGKAKLAGQAQKLAQAASPDETARLAQAVAATVSTVAADAKTFEVARTARDQAVKIAAETAARRDASTRAVADRERTLRELQTQLATARQTLQQKESEKATADKALADATAAIRPLQEAVAAERKALEPVEQQWTISRERLALLEAGPVMPVAKDVRQVASFTHSRPLYSCRIDATGQFVFAGAFGNDVARWNLDDGSKSDLAGHRSWVRRLTFDPSGRTLLTAGYEGRLIWWEARSQSPQPKLTIDAHQGFVRGVAVSPDGSLIATCGNDTLVKVWSATDGSLVRELAGHDRHVYNVAFSPDGAEIVSGDLMGTLHVWQVGSWNRARTMEARVLSKYDTTFRADCGGIRGMDFSPDGATLAVCGISNVTNAFAGIGEPTVVLFDWRTGRERKVLKQAAFRGACWGVRWHPSGEFLVGAGAGTGGALWFWNPDSSDGKPFFEFALPNVAYALDFHPDGLRLAVSLYDRTLRLYDLAPRTSTELALAAAAKKK